MYIETNHQL